MNRHSRSIFPATLLLLASLLPSAQASGTKPGNDVESIARHLDMLSFPNSIGPRHRPDARTLMDYGFTHFEAMPNGVEVTEADGTWRFFVTLVSAHGDTRQLLVEDQALNGGSYHDCSRIEVRLEADGLYHAVGKPGQDGPC